MNIRLKHVFYPANILSILRIILIFPVIYFISQKNFLIAIILSVVTVLTDFFDGYLARKLKHVSDLGKFLDPLADKIALAIIVVYLSITGKTPIWFLFTVIIRDIFVFTGGLILKKIKNIVVQSNMLGKITTVIISVYFLLNIIDYVYKINEIIIQIFLYMSVIFLIVSTIGYVLKFIKISRGQIHENE